MERFFYVEHYFVSEFRHADQVQGDGTRIMLSR